MKRIIIICEGQTEQVFCERTLNPYFSSKNIYIQAPTIKHTRGGIVKWEVLKKQIETHLSSEKDAIVTTFIDYYGLFQKHNFPDWAVAQRELDKVKRMAILETAMKRNIDPKFNDRFIPYLQLHEFEGLLFNDIKFFYDQIPQTDLIGLEELKQTFADYSNPEMINDSKETSPSNRLERIILGYHKTIHGDILAEAIGLDLIRNKTVRFNLWIKFLENI